MEKNKRRFPKAMAVTLAAAMAVTAIPVDFVKASSGMPLEEAGGLQQITPVNAWANTEQAPDGNGKYLATYAIDGDTNTRWSAEWANPTPERIHNCWLTVDLGAVYDLDKVEILWEGAGTGSATGAYAKEYDIQVSDDNKTFRSVCRNYDGSYDGDMSTPDVTDPETMQVQGQGRYVRMQSRRSHADDSGSSIREFRVWGTPTGKDAASDYADILNYTTNTFSDNGAWVRFKRHSLEDTGRFGGFVGPRTLKGGVDFPDLIGKLKISDSEGTDYDLSRSIVTSRAYPGRLVQSYEMDEFIATMTLICSSNRATMIKTELKNKTDKELTLKLRHEGYMSEGSAKVTAEDGAVTTEVWDTYYTMQYSRPAAVSVNGRSYTSSLENLTIAAGETENLYQVQNYTFSPEEETEEKAAAAELLTDSEACEKCFTDNTERWKGYTETIEEGDVEQKYRNAAMKAMMTLMGNWRSAAGDLKHDGIQPFGSRSAEWQAFWPWDSWKHIVATSKFNTELAREESQTHFDFQVQPGDPDHPEDEGTLFDVISFSGVQNDRNTKPPLAAWAVYNYYEETGDLELIRTLYDNLQSYHNWWYRNRDIDQNGIAEYGAMKHSDHYQKDGNGNIRYDENGEPLVDKTKMLEALAWESGMDNAVRFDVEGVGEGDPGILIYPVRNSEGVIQSYVVNQESVDLNAYLYAEKCYLQKMAELLDKPEDAQRYREEAEKIRTYVNENMFDVETGFYYDLQTNEDGSVKKLLTNRGKGTEGWIPLWARMATQAQAEAVVSNMLDPGKFYTKMPFPTSSKDNPKYSPTVYWRGPVWMDQAMFAVEALQNYGYEEEAIEAAYRLFDNAGGLLTDGPIHENYNPETGATLHDSNFSWSSASFYNLFKNILTGAGKTSSQMIADIPADDPELTEQIRNQIISQAIEECKEISESDEDAVLRLSFLKETLERYTIEIPAGVTDLLEEKLIMAQKYAENELTYKFEDKSANSFDADGAVSGENKRIACKSDKTGNSGLRGYFPIDAEGAQESLKKVITEESFTIETTLIPGGSGFSYIAGMGDDGFGLRVNGNSIEYYIYDGSGWKTCYASLQEEDENAPVHLAAVYDREAQKMRLNINGRETETLNVTSVHPSSYEFGIGYQQYPADDTDYNENIFLNFRLYNTALAAEEIAAQEIAADDERVELWYDFDEPVYQGEGISTEPAGVRLLTEDTLSVLPGETAVIEAALVPYYAEGKLQYISDNSEVAEVSENGEVTGKKDGKAVITVSNAEIEGQTASVEVTVGKSDDLQEAEKAVEAIKTTVEEGKTVLKDAGTAAEEAAAEARAAQNQAEAAKKAVTDFKGAAQILTKLQKNAETAGKAAEEAKKRAEEAKASVRAAQEKADTAEDAYQKVKTALESGSLSEEELLSQAKDAQALADEAQTAAEKAKTAARSAKEYAAAQAKVAEIAQNISKELITAAESEKAEEEAVKELAKVREELNAKIKEMETRLAAAKAELEQIKEKQENAAFKAVKMKISSAKSTRKKQAKITWKKVKGAEGYVIQYAMKSNFKGVKNITVKSRTAGSRTIKRLKSKKRYYIRIRAYKTVNGQKIYTGVSPRKVVRIK